MVRAAVLASAVMAVAGCGLLDTASFGPRTYAVNESADSILNDAILLNIIRAANSEPLNFIAIAKYTASNQVSVSANPGTFVYAPRVIHPQRTFGETLGGQQANSFDLNVLETKDFYNGILRIIDVQNLDVFFRQGVARPLIFYALLDAIRITTSSGQVIEFPNDPDEDRWTEDARMPNVQSCEQFLQRLNPPDPLSDNYFDPLFENPLWKGEHEGDCRFSKFRHLIRLATKYGMRSETVPLKEPAKKSASKKSADKKDDSTSDDGKPKTWTQMCTDPALARDYRVPASELGLQRCGRGKPFKGIIEPNVLEFPGSIDRRWEFRLRSPFALFQYLGRLYASGAAERIRFTSGEIRAARHINFGTQLLTIVAGSGSECFASAWYRNRFFCVPADGTENTKHIFTLLRALLAINISPIDLNSTPTFRVVNPAGG